MSRAPVRVERIACGGNNGHNVAQIGVKRITKTDLEPTLSRQRQHLFRDVDGAREPAHMRPCGAQQPQFSERGLT